MRCMKPLPLVIQGGMGVGVSSWQLARSVSRQGMLGVVSGTVIDGVLARRLQQGDPEGHMRRALAAFPCEDTAREILDRWFIEGGLPAGQAYERVSMPTLKMSPDRLKLMVASGFVEVWLAREGHNGPVGINLLEKVQLPNMPTLYGAMLANVDAVLMGAGVPTAIPGVLDSLASSEDTRLRLSVEELPAGEAVHQEFSPSELLPGVGTLRRPDFLAIISSHVIGRIMTRKASGSVEGFVVEHHSAGGHNAPPRNANSHGGDGPSYTGKDEADLKRIADLGLPFWLAGSRASREGLSGALAAGAAGIQVGSAFALCDESGIEEPLKRRALERSRAGSLKVTTSFRASPTGYPFKLVELEDTLLDKDAVKRRKRVCDLGYLRRPYMRENGQVGYRCPAEPGKAWNAKGGDESELEGRLCLCNGLMATIGLGQRRPEGDELPIVTSGDAVAEAARFLEPGATGYSAERVIQLLLEDLPAGELPVRHTERIEDPLRQAAQG